MLQTKLSSRKFLLALAGAVAIFVSDLTGYALSADTVYGLIGVVAVYVGAEGYVDAQNAKAAMADLKQDALANSMIYIKSLEQQFAEFAAQVTPPDPGE